MLLATNMAFLAHACIKPNLTNKDSVRAICEENIVRQDEGQNGEGGRMTMWDKHHAVRADFI